MRNSVRPRNCILAAFALALLPLDLAAQSGPFMRHDTAPTPFIDQALQDSYRSFFEGPPDPDQLAAFALEDSVGANGSVRGNEFGWRWERQGARFEIGYRSGRLEGRLEDGLGLFVDPVQVALHYRRLRLEGRLQSAPLRLGQVAVTASAGIGAEDYKISSSLQSALLDITAQSRMRLGYAVTGVAAKYDAFRINADLRWSAQDQGVLQLGVGLEF